MWNSYNIKKRRTYEIKVGACRALAYKHQALVLGACLDAYFLTFTLGAYLGAYI